MVALIAFRVASMLRVHLSHTDSDDGMTHARNWCQSQSLFSRTQSVAAYVLIPHNQIVIQNTVNIIYFQLCSNKSFFYRAHSKRLFNNECFVPNGTVWREHEWTSEKKRQRHWFEWRLVFFSRFGCFSRKSNGSSDRFVFVLIWWHSCVSVCKCARVCVCAPFTCKSANRWISLTWVWFINVGRSHVYSFAHSAAPIDSINWKSQRVHRRAHSYLRFSIISRWSD